MADYVALKNEVYASVAPVTLNAAYAGMTDPQICAALSAKTVMDETLWFDVSGVIVKATLYARGSLHRVRAWAATPNSGTDMAHDLSIAVAKNLVDQLDNGGAFAMTDTNIRAQVQSDLATLQAQKMADTKGVLWAAGELAAGDAGDAAVLLALAHTQSWPAAHGWVSGIGQADLAIARAS